VVEQCLAASSPGALVGSADALGPLDITLSAEEASGKGPGGALGSVADDAPIDAAQTTAASPQCLDSLVQPGSAPTEFLLDGEVSVTRTPLRAELSLPATLVPGEYHLVITTPVPKTVSRAAITITVTD
jgi:hypothetical protein